MVLSTKELGEWGEKIAAEYLITKGFSMLAYNPTSGHKEVDLIALRGDCIHFIEVKTRAGITDDPVQAVTAAKKRNICRFAENFIQSRRVRLYPQFDIIAINGTPEAGVLRFEYLPDAFRPKLRH